MKRVRTLECLERKSTMTKRREGVSGLKARQKDVEERVEAVLCSRSWQVRAQHEMILI